MTKIDQNRVRIFRRIIRDKGWTHLVDREDEEILDMLNSTVLPNALSLNTVKNTVLFYFIFEERKKRQDEMIKQINSLINFALSLTKTEKMVIKHGVVNGFESRNWRAELWRYIQTPIALYAPSQNRKIISGKKFKEIFFFAYNLVKKGMENARPPRI